MFVFKDNKRTIEITSQDDFFDNSSKFNKERYYALGRYFYKISTFLDSFKKDNGKYYDYVEEYEKSNIYKIRSIISTNYYPELSDFIKEQSYLITVNITKNNKTKSFNDTVYTDELYSVISLYHSLSGFTKLLEQAKYSLKSTYNLGEFYKEDKLDKIEELNTINTYKMLLRQSLNAIKNEPNNLQVFLISKAVFDHIYLNVKIKRNFYDYGFDIMEVTEIPVLSKEEKEYLQSISNKLNQYNVSQNEQNL